METLKHDVGTITAYRVSNCEEREYTEEENCKKSQILYANLLYKGYGLVKTECTYIKNYNMPDFAKIKIENYTAPACQDKNAFSTIPSFSPHLA